MRSIFRATICAAVLLAIPAMAQQKFALAVYHFNIQYVQGGLVGFPDGMTHVAQFELDDDQVHDLIITQGLEPLLDMYARHPTWGCDIEMQGYMVDVMAQRQPQVLAKLQALANARQVQVDSFHWSDQFWLAYPRVDMERSFALTQQSFLNAQLPLGTSVFTQEGQFSTGMERFMRERGLLTAIVPGGVLGYFQNGPTPPLYTMNTTNEVLAVPGGGTQDALVSVLWDWLNDGELAMTNGLDPYVGTGFVYDPASSAVYEQQLEAEETAGYQHVSVATYVQQAMALGEQPAPLPPLVDATWHPDETLNVYRWMGDIGVWDAVADGTSEDNVVNTLAMQAHRKVLEAEQASAAIETTDFDAQLQQAWMDVLLGEASDATGWNPWMGERKYSEAHSNTALAEAELILSDPRIAPHLNPAAAPALVDDPGPFTLTPDTTSERTPTVKWQRRSGTTIWELTLTFPAGSSNAADTLRHTVSVSFPRNGNDLIFTSALEDTTVRDVPLASFLGGAAGIVTVGAPIGLVGLGGGTYVIERAETVHVAARLPETTQVVQFQDESAVLTPITWNFVVLQGTDADAIAEATADNVNPPAVYGPISTTPAKKKGCGCTSPDSAAGLSILLLALPKRRTRRGAKSHQASATD